MTEPPYAGPPPTGAVRQPPQYPPYPGAPYPGAPYPGGPYPGGPYPAPYPGAPYPPWALAPPYGPPVDARPGGVVGAAVVGWAGAALLVLAAVLLFFGAAFVRDFDAGGGPFYATEFTVDGILNVLAAAVLVVGAAQLMSRSTAGRLLLSGGAAYVLTAAVYWLVRWAGRTGGAVIGYAVIFAAVAVVALALAWARDASRWLAGKPPRHPQAVQPPIH